MPQTRKKKDLHPIGVYW